ncbi:MAG: gephyrin-like molybdotransferase Glp [Solidesulfovibrio sp.]
MALNLDLVQQSLLNVARIVDTETVALEQCWQRVLAESVVADIDFPPFDRSPLDGYAVIAAEVEGASPVDPVILQEIDIVPAGEVAHVAVRPGTACRIMTGAPLPVGATGVVKKEDTTRLGDLVQINQGKGAGKNVCRQGEELRRGESALSPGTVINTGCMGTLALLGRDKPLVFRRPRVGILGTGSELAMVSDKLVPGKIHDSNSYMLCAQVREAGGEPVLLGVIHDEVAAIGKRLDQALDCDMVITTGGVSTGDYDLVKEVFTGLGVTLLFEKVRMKPGMPGLGGVRGEQLFVGLSGNPAAASISFEQIIRPVLLKMGGRTAWWRRSARATMTKSFAKGGGPKRFVWAYSWLGETGLLVEPLPLQGNGMLRSSIRANSLISVEENSPPIRQGENIEVLLLQ